MNIDETLLLIIFASIFLLVILWFVFVRMLYKRLASSHMPQYEAMGKPSLFLHNTLAGTLAMLKFLLKREHKVLGDSYLSKLSDIMLAFLLIYIILFLTLFFSIAAQFVIRVL
ncbi:hypothetical protein [Sulfuriferula nivalis]|uniref:Uncharacterized protein n=1 Tax=Sulfuriferula nivalis TaxID=2675298 RepID=A0A809SCV0_9PROT|nr:hypothetical protein [Sulfuriferula nivalis]BBP00127.1 hypothetical protein SFSGTM_08350 [Sulfuriferula nivalis]